MMTSHNTGKNKITKTDENSTIFASINSRILTRFVTLRCWNCSVIGGCWTFLSKYRLWSSTSCVHSIHIMVACMCATTFLVSPVYATTSPVVTTIFFPDLSTSPVATKWSPKLILAATQRGKLRVTGCQKVKKSIPTAGDKKLTLNSMERTLEPRGIFANAA